MEPGLEGGAWSSIEMVKDQAAEPNAIPLTDWLNCDKEFNHCQDFGE